MDLLCGARRDKQMKAFEKERDLQEKLKKIAKKKKKVRAMQHHKHAPDISCGLLRVAATGLSSRASQLVLLIPPGRCTCVRVQAKKAAKKAAAA